MFVWGNGLGCHLPHQQHHSNWKTVSLVQDAYLFIHLFSSFCHSPPSSTSSLISCHFLCLSLSTSASHLSTLSSFLISCLHYQSFRSVLPQWSRKFRRWLHLDHTHICKMKFEFPQIALQYTVLSVQWYWQLHFSVRYGLLMFYPEPEDWTLYHKSYCISSRSSADFIYFLVHSGRTKQLKPLRLQSCPYKLELWTNIYINIWVIKRSYIH